MKLLVIINYIISFMNYIILFLTILFYSVIEVIFHKRVSSGFPNNFQFWGKQQQKGFSVSTTEKLQRGSFFAQTVKA